VLLTAFAASDARLERYTHSITVSRRTPYCYEFNNDEELSTDTIPMVFDVPKLADSLD